jgi:hypothetical protein
LATLDFWIERVMYLKLPWIGHLNKYVSDEIGGTNQMGGLTCAGLKKGATRAFWFVVAFSVLFYLIAAWSQMSISREKFVKIAPLESVPERASWEEYVGNASRCVKPDASLLAAWLVARASCSEKKCVGLDTLAAWQEELVDRTGLNFASSSMTPLNASDDVLIPCACTVTLESGDRVFLLDPEMASSCAKKATHTGAVPILGIQRTARKIPVWITVEHANWPWGKNQTLTKETKFAGRDVNTVLRAMESLIVVGK